MYLPIEIPAEIEAALLEESERRGLEPSEYLKQVGATLRQAVDKWNTGVMQQLQGDEGGTATGWRAVALLKQVLPEGWIRVDPGMEVTSDIALAGGAFFAAIFVSLLLGKGDAKDAYLRLTMPDLLSGRAAEIVLDRKANPDRTDAPYTFRRLPPPGFAAAARLAREASGDLRSGGEILTEQRRAEGKRREEALRGHVPMEETA